MRVEINYKEGVIESKEEAKKRHIKEIGERWHEGFKKHIEKDLQAYLDEEQTLNEQELDRILSSKSHRANKPNTNSQLLPNHYAIL